MTEAVGRVLNAGLDLRGRAIARDFQTWIARQFHGFEGQTFLLDGYCRELSIAFDYQAHSENSRFVEFPGRLCIEHKRRLDSTLILVATWDEICAAQRKSLPRPKQRHSLLPGKAHHELIPVPWIGRRIEVRESQDKVEIQLDARNLVSHRRIAEAEHQQVMLPQHRPPWGQGAERSDRYSERSGS